MNSTIRDSLSMTNIGHRMSCQDKTTIAKEVVMVPSPLYLYIVHIFDALSYMETVVVYQPCRLIITYKKGLH